MTDQGSGTVILPGQWRLSWVQLANWGTFHGLHSLDVSRKGLLITGPSGSGKSSLVDAIATVLTPPRAVQYNAAAAGGKTDRDRTLVSYIRGAWRHESGDAGEVTSSYLRGGRQATWSGVLLRYDSCPAHTEGIAAAKLGRPVYLGALFYLKSGSSSRSEVSCLYFIAREACDLKSAEACMRHGIDSAALKKAIPQIDQVFREHSKFSARFRSLFGMQSERTLTLLHKTQAAKDFDSLDNLFRRFMLDEPKTFAQADEAIDQFQALSRAYQDVADQRSQRDQLKPLLAARQAYDKAQQDLDGAVALSESLDAYTEQTLLNVLTEHHERLTRELNVRLGEQSAAQALAEELQTQVNTAQSVLNAHGGIALSSAEKDALEYENTLRTVEKNRSRLLHDLACADIPAIPEDATEFRCLVQKVAQLSIQAKEEKAQTEDELYRVSGEVDALRKRRDAILEELQHLRKRGTNIPRKLDAIRASIAEHLGISRDELPFIGEMIRVEPAYAQWQGAIERLMHSQAITLLVPAARASQVSRFIDSRHLGVRFEFESVPLEVEVKSRQLSADSLVRRVSVVPCKSHVEFNHWVNNLLRSRFDYHCVEDAAELSRHEFALTKAGQIKRGSRYVKDDRFRLDDRAQWVLGDSNDAKIDEYEGELSRIELQTEEVREAVSAVRQRIRRIEDLERAANALQDADWGSYDILAARANLQGARDYVAQLSRPDSAIGRANEQLRVAQDKKQVADAALIEVRTQVLAIREKLQELDGAILARKSRLGQFSALDSALAQQLSRLFSKAKSDYLSSTETVLETRVQVQKTLEGQSQSHRGKLQRARTQAEHTMHDFRMNWPQRCANLTDDFADVEAYLGILRQIEASGLPDYESRFLQVLNDFSRDQITIIASTIRSAPREVREKLEPVNASLSLSEYDAGVHLVIEVRDTRPQEAVKFLEQLGKIASGTWSNDNIAQAEARYQLVAGIIDRLKAQTYADRRWRTLCLDTREHVGFTAKEVDVSGNVLNVHSSDAGLSGGQRQKLVVFCLAAALRYQLADEDDAVPHYGTVILDEAFDKADHRFTAAAMNIFEAFGFHMILATPLKLLTTLESHVGAVAAVRCADMRYSSISTVVFEEGERADEEEG